MTTFNWLFASGFDIVTVLVVMQIGYDDVVLFTDDPSLAETSRRMTEGESVMKGRR